MRDMETKDVPGFPDYFVGSDGHVYSRRLGRRLRYDDSGRYMRVFLYSASGRSRDTVHAIVARAFHGPRPDGHEVDHINFDKHDNRPCNLRYIPRGENAGRWSAEGRKRSLDGVKAANTRYPDEQMFPAACDVLLTGMGVRAAATKHGVHFTTLYDCVMGRTRKELVRVIIGGV